MPKNKNKQTKNNLQFPDEERFRKVFQGLENEKIE